MSSEIKRNELKLFLQQIKSNNYVPDWIKIKAVYFLKDEISKIDVHSNYQEILDKSFKYFNINEFHYFSRFRNRNLPKFRNLNMIEIKHMIRYALYLHNVPFEKIAQINKCHRTTIYNSLAFIENVSETEPEFSNKLKTYLNYLSYEK